MTSAAEAETGGVYGNAQETIACRISLQALGHPQLATPLIKTDNSTSNSFVHANIKQRRSKTWDMRWNWLRDKSTHDQLRIYWDKGQNNNADYFTKHHPPSHHLAMRPRYVLNAHQATCSRLPFRCEGVLKPWPLYSRYFKGTPKVATVNAKWNATNQTINYHNLLSWSF
jgi:hypothetical protein